MAADESLLALCFSDQRDNVFKLTLRTFCCDKLVTMEQSLADLLRDAFEGKKNTVCFALVSFFFLYRVYTIMKVFVLK